MRYVIARTPSSRPSLMHVLSDDNYLMTACGLDTRAWSRAYMSKPILQILCLRCSAGSYGRR